MATCPKCGATILLRDKAPNGQSREAYNAYQRQWKRDKRKEQREQSRDPDPGPR